MTTKVDLESALKDAIRSHNEPAKRTIRMVLTSIKLMEIEKGQPLDEAAIASVLQKEMKIRQESITDAQKANRLDLISSNDEELEILKSFLPAQLSEDELKELAIRIIQEIGATGPADIGRVMKIIIPQIQGRAAGDQINRVVRELLVSGA